MAAKLLLINDVETLGRSGDIVTVRPGYARNFLLPQGFAMIADKNTIRMQAKLQEERKQKAIVDKNESEQLAASMEGLIVSTTVKVDHDGHMYGSVTGSDIAHLIQEQAGIALEKRSIQLKHAIKKTGDHTINIRLKEGVTSSITLQVIPEEGSGQAKAAE